MICRGILLELTGTTSELALDAIVLRAAGPRASEIQSTCLPLGGLVLQHDGWHVIGLSGSLGPTAHPSAEGAIDSLLSGRLSILSKELAP